MPTLRPCDVVVLDNIAVLKQLAVRTAIERASAFVPSLPSYSPDFNPIERAFAKLKAYFRAARPRTFDQVVDMMRIAIGLFTPQECTDSVRNCGYRRSTVL